MCWTICFKILATKIRNPCNSIVYIKTNLLENRWSTIYSYNLKNNSGDLECNIKRYNCTHTKQLSWANNDTYTITYKNNWK